MMKNTTLFMMMALVSVTGWAQTDTSRMNIGWLSLDSSLTQTLRIKGEDLEKMPFANLSDAINAWYYGAYTQPQSLQYFVDGSPVADVNAYSVFDIEEVVLVENAAAMAYTGGSQQEVVLIRTRRGKARTGMTAAVQTGLVSGGNIGVSTDSRWYHQYYLGANIHPGQWAFGASASWLRDILPTSESYSIVTPDNLQRWRLHGYADWQPDRHEQLELTVGYVPQRFRAGYDSTVQGYLDYTSAIRSSASQRFFLPEFRWRSEWLGGLTNELQASYVQSVYQGAQPTLTTPVPDTSNAYYIDSIGGYRSSYHAYVRDRLAYRLAAGGWRIEPAMTVSYEHADERLSYRQDNDEYDGQGDIYYSYNVGTADGKYHLLTYTPQLDISYKKGFDLTGGELFQAGLQELPGSHKTFFFISGSLDFLRLANENSHSGLAIFGSYAQRAIPSLPGGYQVADLTYGYSNENLFGSSNYFAYTGTSYVYYDAAELTQRFWVWEAGVRYTGWKDRVEIQGNIERRNYALLEFVDVPAGSNFSTLELVRLTASDLLLHLDVRVKILEGSGANWESGVNATTMRSKLNVPTTVTMDGQLLGYTGDMYPNPYSVTGGWVNRVRVQHFTGGLDLLYHLGETYFETAPGSFPVVTRKLNPVAVPNVYAGYKFDPAHKEVEVFAESRGLFRTNPSDLPDNRRYYTIGGKLTL